MYKIGDWIEVLVTGSTCADVKKGDVYRVIYSEDPDAVRVDAKFDKWWLHTKDIRPYNPILENI